MIGATLGATLEGFLKPALAFAISIPIGALAFRVLYLNRLSSEDREFRRAALGRRTAERVFWRLQRSLAVPWAAQAR